MIPYSTIIQLDRKIGTPVYIQLCNQLIQLIKQGKLSPATKLPGSRLMAEQLSIHRKTVVAAYDELMAQGWLESKPAKGTFVNTALPIVKSRTIAKEHFSKKAEIPKKEAGFSFHSKAHLNRPDSTAQKEGVITLDDGVPDSRIAPIEEIARTYRSIVQKSYNRKLLTYGSIYGNGELRETLASYLNETRGLAIQSENILITRGSQMGIYLAGKLLLESEGNIVVGTTNYRSANKTFIESGGVLNKVNVDDKGLITDEIAALCQQKNIKAVYVTSHHHHPTTVTLSAERRMHLLELSQQYNFAIIEDDYDYDFHYNNAPILPLASGDEQGNVVYIGALCKIVAPAIRVGYMVAPSNFVDEAARYRRIIDRQGDALLEAVMARMIKNGDVQRHSKKALKIYKDRRDLFCSLLKEKLGKYFEFEIPEGGMAVWAMLKKPYSWDELRKEAATQNLAIADYCWDREENDPVMLQGMRLGFASLNEEEIREAVNRLALTFQSLDSKI
ncbi:PLP-dependent aminotransferase family protein [Flammeovirgaceae bacterium SG7u.111]|nr:PLP-dependent aminotransferase family protein [Flammeovirgaceae bacterium SG7u.132]WPO36013.1 PLP-dependent aminotransferase family protein [Flammeovirgaceae bacterium SG7u.111]